MALCLVVLMGMAAMGFDLSYARLARLQLQNATDAASHAALVRLRVTGDTAAARAMAISVASQNVVHGHTLTLTSSDITFGGWDFAQKLFIAGAFPANAVQIVGSRSSLRGADGAIGTTFGRVLGVNRININHSGTAAYRIRSVVVAQDITGSFAGSIDSAADADVAMLDQMHTYNVSSDRIGMQLFTGDGTAWTALTNLKTGYSAVRVQWFGDGKQAADTTKTSGITVCNKLDVDSHATAPMNHAWVPHCSSGGDGTNQGAAIQRATDQLLAQAQAYETRVIVLITDGKPACCTVSGSSTTCSETNSCATTRAANGVTQANYAAANGISIYTVSYGADAQQHAYNASLARGIGTAYNTPDETQLVSILREIAGTIPIALVQ
jgi:Putative Flp pilus-assembly TadE/G-like/von Willebrand factor type A domain